MAITRTQIAKQLLAQGGRTGFQYGGGGKDAATESFAQSIGGQDYADEVGSKYGFQGEGPDDRFRSAKEVRTEIASRTQEQKEEIAKKEKELLFAIEEAEKARAKANLSFADKGNIYSLKKLYEQKTLPNQSRYGPIFAQVLSAFSPRKLEVYESTSEDDIMDTGYGMTGEDLTDTDRLADAINKAEATGDISREEYLDAFYGPNNDNPNDPRNRDTRDGPDDPVIPIIPQVTSPAVATEEDDYYADVGGNPFINKNAYRFMNKGGIADTAVGGEYDFESARQMYGLGKLVKKITRGVKKIAKSPIGKAAIIGGLGYLASTGGISSFFGKGSFNPFLKIGAGGQSFSPFGAFAKKLGIANLEGGLTGFGKIASMGIPSILAALKTKPEDEDEDEDYRGEKLDIAGIRENPYAFIPRRFAAEGGDIEPVAKKTMPLLDMDGQEKDYRETGGFVDMGRMEKADDVPARLSKNEFVFTADAVRNAGEGNIDKGAEVMYNMMKNLEAGGDVSEESQGLEGAKQMFQTSQRLEEVL